MCPNQVLGILLSLEPTLAQLWSALNICNAPFPSRTIEQQFWGTCIAVDSLALLPPHPVHALPHQPLCADSHAPIEPGSMLHMKYAHPCHSQPSPWAVEPHQGTLCRRCYRGWGWICLIGYGYTYSAISYANIGHVYTAMAAGINAVALIELLCVDPVLSHRCSTMKTSQYVSVSVLCSRR